MNVEGQTSAEPIKPKAILKLVEQEKNTFSDSGMADSRNVTFSPLPTKVIEFSPLACSDQTKNGCADVSVCVPGANDNHDSDSDEITLDSSLENAPTGPMQSSGLTDMGFNVQDFSTINQGLEYKSELLKLKL